MNAPDPIQALREALARRDFESAEHHAVAAESAWTPDLPALIAELRIGQRRWADAARALSSIPAPTTEHRLALNQSKNLAALETHRPRVYERLIAHPEPQDIVVVESADGLPTLARMVGEHVAPIVPAGDVRKHLELSQVAVREAYKAQQALALPGICDGYMLRLLCDSPPQLAHGAELAVHIFEPDLDFVWAALQLHDFSDRKGPIRGERFRWHVGQKCIAEFESDIADLRVPFPRFVVPYGPSLGTTKLALDRCLDRYHERNEALAMDVSAVYDVRDDEAIARALRGTDRPPRVLLITSRFTTVLQYATQDAADAFAELGWDTRVLKEEAAWMRLSHLHLRDQLRTFQPDLVFVLDFNRTRWPGLFPPQLPYVCWAQDHLPNLVKRSAGRRMTPRDFIASEFPTMYVKHFDYPARQNIGLAKCTKPVKLPKTWHHDGDDLVYVSHVSAFPEQLAAHLVDQAEPRLAPLYERLTDEILQIYRWGEALAVEPELYERVRIAARELGVELSAAEHLRISGTLMHPFNSALYRQQALRWARDVAERNNLRLSIYGNGWRDNPEFREVARGPVEYGAQLEEVTRRARINLQVGTYLCTHQRMLDGLVAGGFYLVRRQINERVLEGAAAITHAFLGGRVVDLADARHRMQGPARAVLENFIRDCGALAGNDHCEDPFVALNGFRQSEIIDEHGQLMPRLEAVSFESEQELESLVLHYNARPAAREAIRRAQAESVTARFTYTAGIERVVRHVRSCLDEDAARAQDAHEEVGPEPMLRAA